MDTSSVSFPGRRSLEASRHHPVFQKRHNTTTAVINPSSALIPNMSKKMLSAPRPMPPEPDPPIASRPKQVATQVPANTAEAATIARYDRTQRRHEYGRLFPSRDLHAMITPSRHHAQSSYHGRRHEYRQQYAEAGCERHDTKTYHDQSDRQHQCFQAKRRLAPCCFVKADVGCWSCDRALWGNVVGRLATEPTARSTLRCSAPQRWQVRVCGFTFGVLVAFTLLASNVRSTLNSGSDS